MHQKLRRTLISIPNITQERRTHPRLRALIDLNSDPHQREAFIHYARRAHPSILNLLEGHLTPTPILLLRSIDTQFRRLRMLSGLFLDP